VNSSLVQHTYSILTGKSNESQYYTKHVEQMQNNTVVVPPHISLKLNVKAWHNIFEWYTMYY